MEILTKASAQLRRRSKRRQCLLLGIF